MAFASQTFNPLPYPRLARAWRAALALLDSGDWVSREELYAAMLPASDLQKKTCSNLLADGRRSKLFDLDPPPGEGGYPPGRGGGPQRFRLRPEMRSHISVAGVVRSAQELEIESGEVVK